jgi:manganese/zinc/iron transport system permease protein
MLISINAVTCFSTIGALLTLAFIVIPAGTAYLLNKNLVDMILTSLIFSIFASISGYFLAVEIDLPISATIGMVMVILFVIIFGINQLVLNQKLNTREL